VGAVAYSFFAGAMAVGRLSGDRLADRLGPARLVRLSAATAAVGFATALLISATGAALAGFVVLGLGLSVVVPLVFTAAAQQGRAGPRLAVVSGAGYIGFLVGPPIIGGLASVAGLPEALGVVVAVSAMTAVLAPAVGSRRTSSPSDESPIPGH
jgi:MFS family permease